MPIVRRGAAPTEVNGLTCKVIIGTTAAAEAGVTTIAHGLTVAQIVSWSSQVKLATSSVNQGHVSTAGLEFQVSLDATNAIVRLDNTNSENLLSKMIEILIWFEA